MHPYASCEYWDEGDYRNETRPSNHQGKRSHKHTPSEKSGLVAETLQAARMQQLRLLNEEGGDKTEGPEYEIEYD